MTDIREQIINITIMVFYFCIFLLAFIFIDDYLKVKEQPKDDPFRLLNEQLKEYINITQKNNSYGLAWQNGIFCINATSLNIQQTLETCAHEYSHVHLNLIDK